MIADPSKSRLSYLFTVILPQKFQEAIRSIAGEKVANIVVCLGNRYLSVLYLIVVVGSWIFIFFDTYPWIDAHKGKISQNHKVIGYAVFLACVISWRIASTVSPGVISSENIEQFDNYPYDEILFVQGRICPTTGIRKLARSKFDRYTNVHVSKFDHFCGWLHNAIGEQNYRWFLLFLLVHVSMCAYGTTILGYLFSLEVEKHRLWDQTFFNTNTGEEFKATPYVVFHYLFQRRKIQSGLFLLLTAMTVVLNIFLSWHCWIACLGMTTNESVKWTQIRKSHKIKLRLFSEAVRNGSSADNSEASDEEKILHPGPEPKNIYNIGLIENWKDVFFPRSLRKEAMNRVKTTSTPSTNINKAKAS